MSMIQILPLEGYRWRVRVLVRERFVNDEKLIKEVLCFKFNILVTRGVTRKFSTRRGINSN